MRRIIHLLLIASVILGVAAAIWAFVGKHGGNGPGWTVVEVKRGDITEKALAVGQVEPRERFQVKAKVSGIVKRCFVEVGDRVRAGDPLFEIAPDPTPQELLDVDHRVRSAEAVFERARADLERGRELHAQGLMPKGDLDRLAEGFELARVALEQARDNRELTRSGRVTGGATRVETVIRAPASGTVLSRAVDVGDPVVPLTSYQPGTELAAVADMGDLLFKGTVDEIDVGKIAVGMPCRIKVGALPDAPVRGYLARIAPQAQRSEGATLFEVEVELEQSQDVVLRAGYSANADVVIREKTGVLTIPERLVNVRPALASRAFGHAGGIGELGNRRVRIVIDFGKIGTDLHVQRFTQRCVGIGRPGQFRHIGRELPRVVEHAVMDQKLGQKRGEGFRDGVDNVPCLGRLPVRIMLEQDHAILNHEEGVNGIRVQEFVRVAFLSGDSREANG